MLALSWYCRWNYNTCTCQYSKNLLWEYYYEGHSIKKLIDPLEAKCIPLSYLAAFVSLWKSPGGRHHRPKRKNVKVREKSQGCSWLGPNPSVCSVRDTRLPPVRAHHTWILLFVTQSATSRCLGVSLPSKHMLISLCSCQFRAGKNTWLILRFERSCLAFVPER